MEGDAAVRQNEEVAKTREEEHEQEDVTTPAADEETPGSTEQPVEDHAVADDEEDADEDGEWEMSAADKKKLQQQEQRAQKSGRHKSKPQKDTAHCSVLVADTAAFIKNAPLYRLAERVVTVPEVLAEIRDEEARRRLKMLPFELEVRNPSPAAIAAMSSFAKKTGDLRALSATDLHVLALAYMLDVEAHGSDKHLNAEPKKGPAKKKRNRKNRKRGKNKAAANDAAQKGSGDTEQAAKSERTHAEAAVATAQAEQKKDESVKEEVEQKEDKQEEQEEGATSEVANKDDEQAVAAVSGDDNGNGEEGDEDEDAEEEEEEEEGDNNAGDNEASNEEEVKVEVDDDDDDEQDDEHGAVADEDNVATADGHTLEQLPSDGDDDDDAEWQVAPTKSKKMTEAARRRKEAQIRRDAKFFSATGTADGSDGWITPANMPKVVKKMKKENVDKYAFSKVACMTTDFAMQNVLLQKGLRLMSLDGLLVHRLRYHVLKCEACFAVTTQTNRDFCQSCGHPTLQRVSAAVDKRGQVKVFEPRVKRVNLKGTKYSVPMPKGGRDRRKNLILTEDQQARVASLPAPRKKVVDVFSDDFLEHLSPFGTSNAPSRRAVNRKPVPGYGRRNPNEPKPKGKSRRK
ncbi:hypothetical protein PTSG_01946 [Salpingoeca rosetta]|uniref:RNA-binding protein NOB1 n=1 Tax=Salpingoeca rosetta (strain ATCC 50818 / BSB-021) TaxID=946362 RepID=F2TZE9_SALR5|nr:uncharacterized protein PTSG_01946 [Salpingoeca rosetta]EGD78973.1 hypothetical protein PTSG_01946 [Salpingoeca rosetta]|eukprot:XP_004997929.1 hypothetical protein PTSG_01946 [Salpingoeca rosetta]